MLQSCTQLRTLHKVRAQVNIDGNERAHTLAKSGRDLKHRNAKHSYELAHATSYYYQKDKWPSMLDTPDKGPVRYLEKQIIKYDMKNN